MADLRDNKTSYADLRCTILNYKRFTPALQGISSRIQKFLIIFCQIKAVHPNGCAAFSKAIVFS
jgi:hypothetical protein